MSRIVSKQMTDEDRIGAAPGSVVAVATWKVWIDDGSRYPMTGYGATREDARRDLAEEVEDYWDSRVTCA